MCDKFSSKYSAVLKYCIIIYNSNSFIVGVYEYIYICNVCTSTCVCFLRNPMTLDCFLYVVKIFKNKVDEGMKYSKCRKLNIIR